MRVTSAEYVKDYKIKLIFSDGAAKIVDFKPLLTGKRKLFIPLLDLEYFQKFYVDEITICWPNELDFCPDVLYEIGKDVKDKEERVKRPKQSLRKSQLQYQATYALTKRAPKKRAAQKAR